MFAAICLYFNQNANKPPPSVARESESDRRFRLMMELAKPKAKKGTVSKKKKNKNKFKQDEEDDESDSAGDRGRDGDDGDDEQASKKGKKKNKKNTEEDPKEKKEDRDPFALKDKSLVPKKEGIKFETKRLPGESFHAYRKRLYSEAQEIVNQGRGKLKEKSEKKKKYLAKRTERKKEKKRNRNFVDDRDEPVKDKIEFGEVADRPPDIKVKPKARRHNIRASEMKTQSYEEQEMEKHQEDRSKAERRMMEMMRDRAQLAYKNAKKRKAKELKDKKKDAEQHPTKHMKNLTWDYDVRD